MIFALPTDTRNLGLRTIIDIGVAMRKGEQIDLKAIDMLAARLIDLLADQKFQGVVVPVAVADHSHYTIAHALNVAIYSTIMAKRLDLRNVELKEVTIGALLHDVGKINTPDHLVWKQDSDDHHERVIIAEHPGFGVVMLRNTAVLSETVLAIINDHHETYDGTGYPKGLMDASIAPAVKVVAVCNYYDYLITEMPSKKALTPRDAILHINRLGGKRFHPRISQAFAAEMVGSLMHDPIFPVGSLVLLNTGEAAKVTAISGQGDTMPEVLILTNAQREKIARALPVNLRKDQVRRIARIVKLAEAN